MDPEETSSSSVTVRTGDKRPESSIDAVKESTSPEKTYEKLKYQVGHSGGGLSISEIDKFISKFINDSKKAPEKKNVVQIPEPTMDSDEEEDIPELPSDTAENLRWESALEDFGTFEKCHIMSDQMDILVKALSEKRFVRTLAFSNCTIARRAYESLLVGALVEQSLQVLLFLFSGMDMDNESLQLIGRCFNAYSSQYLAFVECDLGPASLRELYEGLAAEGLIDSSSVQAQSSSDRLLRHFNTRTLDLRGNGSLLVRDDAPDALWLVASAKKLDAIALDSYIITSILDEKGAQLQLLPNIYEVDLSYWMKLINLFKVRHISMKTFHGILSNKDELIRFMKESDRELECLTVPTASLQKQRFIRAVAEVVVSLGVKELNMKGSLRSPSASCMRILLDHLIRNNHNLHCLSLTGVHRMKRCESIVADMLVGCNVYRLEASTILLPTLIHLLQRIWNKNFYKVCELALDWKAVSPYFWSSSSSDDPVLSTVIGGTIISSSSSSNSSSSSSLSSEDQKQYDTVCKHVSQALQFVSKRIVLRGFIKEGRRILVQIKDSLRSDPRYTLTSNGNDLVIEIKDQTRGQIGWFRNAVGNIRRGLNTCERLQFCGATLSPQELYDLGGLLRFCDLLSEVTLEDCGLGDDDIEELTVSLAKNPSKMRLINLSGNSNLGEKSAKSISTLITVRYVQRVRVIGCSLSRYHEAIMTPALLQIPQKAGTSIEYAEDKVDLVLDSNGAAVEFHEGECTVFFPENAVHETKNISLKLRDPDKSRLLLGTVPATSMLQCLPSGLIFDIPMTVRIVTWVKGSKQAKNENKVNFKLLTREDSNSPWKKEAEHLQCNGGMVEFQSLHFSDHEVATEEQESQVVGANYCNMLFISKDPLPHGEPQYVKTCFVPNSRQSLNDIKTSMHQNGYSFSPSCELPMHIEGQDQISVSIVVDGDAAAASIRPAEVVQISGADILRDTRKIKKFEIGLTNASPSEEVKTLRMMYRILRNPGGDDEDPFVLKWRPKEQGPVRQVVNVNYVTIIKKVGQLVVTGEALPGDQQTIFTSHIESYIPPVIPEEQTVEEVIPEAEDHEILRSSETSEDESEDSSLLSSSEKE